MSKREIGRDDFSFRGRVRDATLPLARPGDREARKRPPNGQMIAGSGALRIGTTSEISVRIKMRLNGTDLVTNPTKHAKMLS